MKLARTRSTAAIAAAALAMAVLATACNRGSDSTAGAGGDKPAIGIDLPRSDRRTGSLVRGHRPTARR